ncbi:MAG: ABC transporter substrate-binding protein [Acidimicrobiales bacterium]|nr:ABC transporter substrate-binding protein [Acidimicrobiales bacterium]
MSPRRTGDVNVSAHPDTSTRVDEGALDVGRFRREVAIAVSVVVAALSLAACGGSPTPGVSAGTRETGGTATWAEAPDTRPDYIFPFMSLAYFTVANINQFQYLMYRPLYWFGQGAQPTLNPSLSLAKEPVYSAKDTTVVVKLKPYKWSDGETVTVQDVMFWMNMLHSNKTGWAGYTPNSIPDDIKGITVDSTTQLTFTLNAPVNPEWFTYNQLSQITPLPVAWDVTSTGAAAGSGGCSTAPFGTADPKCNAVYSYLSKEAGNDPGHPNTANAASTTYATNALWQVVDGPWKLASIDGAGNTTFVRNKSYSGSPKPTLSKFVEVPFATEDEEYKALVGGHISFGYLPLSEVTKPTANPVVAAGNGPHVGGYSLVPLYTWSIDYFPSNFNSTGDGGNAGNIWKQLYFRQAFQYLVDQPHLIHDIDKGYGLPTYGPVPLLPANVFVSRVEKANPYPYSVSKAEALLSGHGWKVVAGGTTTCTDPGTATGQCGKDIPAGAKLAFTLQYASGNPLLEATMSAERSSWAQAGIDVTLSPVPFNTVVGNATACTPGPNCTWELENWGIGWVYEPDHYPTGEQTFGTAAPANSGSYSDPTNDKLTVQTITTDVPLTKWEIYLAQQLPVVWQPNTVTEMSEIRDNLRGATPQNPSWSINPENWYFVKK